MLDPKLYREDPDRVRAALRDRGDDLDLDALLAADRERRERVQAVEAMRAELKAASAEIGKAAARAKKGGGEPPADLEERKAALRELGDRIAEQEAGLEEAQARWDHLAMRVPNLPEDDVPRGADESANREVRVWGEPPSFDFEPRAHWDLGEALGILDFERAAKIAGARFAILQGAGARLERALIGFMLDLHTTEHGYVETLPPFLVNADALRGTGNLPKFEEDLFKVDDRLYLIPTAEVPVTNYHQGEILDEEALPVRYAAWTACFRSEAGSYGKDTRGLIRQHQFNKVELVQLVRPEDSTEALEALTGHARAVLEALELPYRQVVLSTGDMGFSSAKTYDLEVWMPGQGAYREISSCSNFRDFQARRARIRCRGGKGKPRLVHTLNGSGLAIGRSLVAILENGQQADGSVVIPAALRPYMGGRDRITAEA